MNTNPVKGFELAMAKKPFKPSHLELRHKTYYALLVVPKDVRHLIKKTKFFKSTQTSNLKEAELARMSLLTLLAMRSHVLPTGFTVEGQHQAS